MLFAVLNQVVKKVQWVVNREVSSSIPPSTSSIYLIYSRLNWMCVCKNFLCWHKYTDYSRVYGSMYDKASNLTAGLTGKLLL